MMFSTGSKPEKTNNYYNDKLFIHMGVILYNHCLHTAEEYMYGCTLKMPGILGILNHAIPYNYFFQSYTPNCWQFGVLKVEGIGGGKSVPSLHPNILF